MTPSKTRETSIPTAIGVLVATFLLVLSVGLFVGYRFFWNQFDQTSRLDAEAARWSGELDRDANNFQAVYQLGWTYFQKGDLARALAYNQKAVELQSQHAGAIYNLGMTYFGLKQYESAGVQFKRLADQYPRHELAWLSLGRTYLELGKKDEAVQALEHTLAINPTSSDIRFSLGQAYDQTGKKDAAIAQYKEALRYDPQYKQATEALSRLGVAN